MCAARLQMACQKVSHQLARYLSAYSGPCQILRLIAVRHALQLIRCSRRRAGILHRELSPRAQAVRSNPPARCRPASFRGPSSACRLLPSSADHSAGSVTTQIRRSSHRFAGASCFRVTSANEYYVAFGKAMRCEAVATRLRGGIIRLG